MKHLEVSNRLHDSIRFYCALHKINIKDFAEKTFKDHKELKQFEKQRRKLKFLSS